MREPETTDVPDPGPLAVAGLRRRPRPRARTSLGDPRHEARLAAPPSRRHVRRRRPPVRRRPDRPHPGLRPRRQLPRRLADSRPECRRAERPDGRPARQASWWPTPISTASWSTRGRASSSGRSATASRGRRPDGSGIRPTWSSTVPGISTSATMARTTGSRSSHPDGKLLRQWGGHGVGPGEFLRPQALAIDGRRPHLCRGQLQSPHPGLRHGGQAAELVGDEGGGARPVVVSLRRRDRAGWVGLRLRIRQHARPEVHARWQAAGHLGVARQGPRPALQPPLPRGRQPGRGLGHRLGQPSRPALPAVTPFPPA